MSETDKKNQSKTAKPKPITLDPDDFTLGEIEDFEDVTGVSFDVISSGSRPAKAIRGLVWIAMRRDDPDLDFDSLRDMKINAVSEMMGGNEPVVEGELNPL